MRVSSVGWLLDPTIVFPSAGTNGFDKNLLSWVLRWKESWLHEPLHFLLNTTSRRCWLAALPSLQNVTGILFSVLFVLDFIDTLIVFVLDLDDLEVIKSR